MSVEKPGRAGLSQVQHLLRLLDLICNRPGSSMLGRQRVLRSGWMVCCWLYIVLVLLLLLQKMLKLDQLMELLLLLVEHVG